MSYVFLGDGREYTCQISRPVITITFQQKQMLAD